MYILDPSLFIGRGVNRECYHPLSTWLSWAAQRKINRRWTGFEHRLKTRYSHNPVLQEIISACGRP